MKVFDAKSASYRHIDEMHWAYPHCFSAIHLSCTFSNFPVFLLILGGLLNKPIIISQSIPIWTDADFVHVFKLLQLTVTLSALFTSDSKLASLFLLKCKVTGCCCVMFWYTMIFVWESLVYWARIILQYLTRELWNSDQVFCSTVYLCFVLTLLHLPSMLE